jgi:hypothetical protein
VETIDWVNPWSMTQEQALLRVLCLGQGHVQQLVVAGQGVAAEAATLRHHRPGAARHPLAQRVAVNVNGIQAGRGAAVFTAAGFQVGHAENQPECC